MGFAATTDATTNAWRAARPKKGAVSTAFVGRSNTIRTRTMIVLMAHATGKTCARTTIALLVHPRRSVCPTIVLMGFVATTFAWAVAKHAVRRKKAADKMGFAGRSKPLRIPITNAIPANVMARARARRVPNQRMSMARRARHRRNALPAFARTVCVVTVGVWARVRRARRAKKEVALTARADRSPMIVTRTKNAGAALVMGRACASNTMACPARTKLSAYPIFASMVSVAETFARARVMRARRRVKAAVTTERAGRFFRGEIPITSVILANVMVRGPAIRPKRCKPMARRALRLDNARPANASMDSVATRRAPVRVKHAAPPKKGAAPMARAGTSLRKPILTTNVVMVDAAAAMARASSTMVCPAHPRPSVFPTFARTGFVAETFATKRVMRARPRKRAKASMAHAEPSPMPKIPITNVLRGLVMAPVLVRALRPTVFPQVAHASRAANAPAAFVITSFAKPQNLPMVHSCG